MLQEKRDREGWHSVLIQLCAFPDYSYTHIKAYKLYLYTVWILSPGSLFCKGDFL